MLYYKINSLDALDKLKEANYLALKKETSRKVSKTAIPNPYDFL